MKKPVLNPTLTLTLMLGLPAKHSGIFHRLYKGKFLVSSRWARVGTSEADALARNRQGWGCLPVPVSYWLCWAALSLAPTLNSPKTYLYTTSVFDIQVELCFMNATFTLYLAPMYWKCAIEIL